MVSDSTDSSSAPGCPWNAREAELLAVTLSLLQQYGYDRLTVEAVATEAKASKATMYRRWPSKAALVLAAFIEGTRDSAIPPRTGSLRTDLLAMGAAIRQQLQVHAATMRAVLDEMSRSEALSEAMQTNFIHQRQQLIREVLGEAVTRGEIDAAVINPEIWDLMPGYLVFRAVVSGDPPSDETVRALVDEVLLPSLTRGTRSG